MRLDKGDRDEPDASSVICRSVNESDPPSFLVVQCKLCSNRLGRRNCPHQACYKCCTDPACKPHRDALRKKSLLDGTDWITRAAAEKRESRVADGRFCDADIQYFGETVVIWDINAFMQVPKWREDALRRSRNRQDSYDLDSAAVGGRKRRRKEGERASVAVPAGKKDASKRIPVSRKKRFKNICDELYQKSLSLSEK